LTLRLNIDIEKKTFAQTIAQSFAKGTKYGNNQ
jgi:hypothetical protein